MSPRISLEQWRALIAVVESGGYAQAALELHKTQSSVTYAVKKLEKLLDTQVFRIEGRRARLTPNGEMLYRRARQLVEEAATLERASRDLAAGWESELRLAIDVIVPTVVVLRCIDRFAAERPDTRIHLYESVLGGTDEALTERRVDLAVVTQVPPGFLGDPLLRVRFVAVAHPEHALHLLDRPLNAQDLRQHRQLIVRDTSRLRPRDSGTWIATERRWTFSDRATSIAAATMGLGFAWFPVDTIAQEIKHGLLKPLPLSDGGERIADLHLVYADSDYVGPGARRMGEIFRDCAMQMRNADYRQQMLAGAGRKAKRLRDPPQHDDTALTAG